MEVTHAATTHGTQRYWRDVCLLVLDHDFTKKAQSQRLHLRIGKPGTISMRVTPQLFLAISRCGPRGDKPPPLLEKTGYRQTLPTKLCYDGCSFQFGRTSILFPRLPHLAQTTLLLKYGTSVSAGLTRQSVPDVGRHRSGSTQSTAARQARACCRASSAGRRGAWGFTVSDGLSGAADPSR
jgi:hypothetical protein